MQIKQLLLGLTCYSITASAFAADPTPTYNSRKEETKTSSAPAEEIDCPYTNPHSFRLSIKHIEGKGIGYDQGYTSVDTFFNFTSIGNCHPFFDVRAHFFNNGRVAANTGFGLRYQPKSVSAIFGVNGFFDFRNTTHSTFEQVGAGLEALGSKWEGRINGYFPIIKKSNLYETEFVGFQQHSSVFAAKRELAFKGLNATLGRNLLRRQYYTLSTTLGGYMFFADYNKSAKGGLLKLKSNISRYFSVEGQASYDSLFKGIVQGQAALNIPFGKRVKARKKGLSCTSSLALAERITESVDRFEIIVTDRTSMNSNGKDPRTNEDLVIVFVDNTATGGDGTAETPFSTLQAAQNASSPGDMIYVYSGTATSTGQDSGIVLQNNQWLQGSGQPFTVLTSYGLSDVPAQTTSWPTIGNSSGDAITLANGNLVTGLNISASGACISGTDISSSTIRFNNLAHGTYDFYFDNPSGSITVSDNVCSSEQGLFLDTDNNLAFHLTDNILDNAGNKNLSITVGSSANALISIGFNTIRNSSLGSSIDTTDTAYLSLNVEGNIFINSATTALNDLLITSGDSSTILASIRGNDISSRQNGLGVVTNDSSKTLLYVIDNIQSFVATPSSGVYGFNFELSSSATTGASSLLLLQDNSSTSPGYLLNNDSTNRPFYVQSPTLTLDGVESLNTGTFTTTGDITYISYTPSDIPNID